MPAVVKEPSEYQNNFQWHQSRKSRSYSPPLQAMKPAAGVRSEVAAKSSEPTITIKKKNVPTTTTNSIKFEEGQGDDFMLLGNHDKFAQNVQYRTKSRDRAMNLLKKSQPTENGDRVESPPLAPRRKPAPQVKYDPGAPSLKAKKSDIEPTKTKSSKAVEVQNGKSLPQKSALKSNNKSETRPKLHEPVRSKGEPEKRKFEPVLQLQPKRNQEVLSKENKPSPQKKEKKEQRKGQMHEFVQADMDKGVAYSGQEAPADYAMKYKAGIAPPRTKGPKRLSEYAMQFQWKKGFPSSPMLAAEQIVYKNNPQAPPFHPDSMAKASEYKKQFQPWHMLKSTPNLAVAIEEEEMEPQPQKKSRKHKRSKSLEDLGPDQRPAAGGITNVSAEDKRMIKESMNPQKLHFPHGKFKKLRSEYESNFAPPQKFDYDQGAWRGADPPHIAQKAETYSQHDEVATSVTWFQEVMELRKRAQEYKKRALGTHFSRQHTGQLYGKSAEVWDTASDAGQSVVSALSLETPGSSRSRASSKASLVQAKGNKKDAWKEKEDEDMYSNYTGSQTPASERTLTPDASLADYDEVDEDLESVSTYKSDKQRPKQTRQAGRVPTPKLNLNKNRHHLDRTTPTSAHALRESLSAPAMVTSSQQQNRPSAYGRPTEDSHLLLDEDAHSDHTLELNFIRTQPQAEKERDELLQSRLSTIKEMSAEYKSTGNKSTKKSGIVPQLSLTVDDIPARPDDDCISFSARSIASSSSLASVVLERAKNRRDGFWSDNKAN